MRNAVSFQERVYQLLTAHPGVPFDGMGLARVGGVYAWRTRVAEVRKRLEREGKGTVAWQSYRQSDGSVRSLYTYVPGDGGSQ